MRFRLLTALLLPGIVVAFTGCGAKELPPPPKTYAVKGKIVLPGNVPLNGGRLTFVPKTDKPTALEGFAELEPDGTFQPTLFQQNDGLTPGTWVVAISPQSQYKGKPRTVNNDKIPQKYRSTETSPLTIEVKDSDVSPTLELK